MGPQRYTDSRRGLAYPCDRDAPCRTEYRTWPFRWNRSAATSC